MIGTFLFWSQYIIAVILLYHILRCTYVKHIKVDKYSKEYIITDTDKKLKHPLWLLIVLIMITTIPVVNIAILFGYLLSVVGDGSSKYNKYYCKSIFTKEY